MKTRHYTWGVLVVLLYFLANYAFADNGCVTLHFYKTALVTNPTVVASFSEPEPGLTNETMTIGGYVSWEPGDIDVTDTFSGCLEGMNVTSYSWPITNFSLSIPGLSPTSIGFSPWYSWIDTWNFSFSLSQAGDEVPEAIFVGLSNTNGYEQTSIDLLYVPFSVLPRRPLIQLSFDSSQLPGDRGQLPILATNIDQVPSPFGTGINFDSSQGIHLEYPAFQNDAFYTVQLDGVTTNYSTGSPNIRRNEGTIRFWFQPNWSSGSGPANGGVFFDMLGSSAPNWTLVVTNTGSMIKFFNAGGGFSVSVSLTADQWYQITATYSGSQTVLYTNGVMAGSVGSGVSTFSYAAISSFLVGSDGANEQVRGIMDQVKTYNYAMSSSEVLADYEADASLDTDGAGIPNIIQFENGTDPYAPGGGSSSTNAPITGSSAPVIQLIDPINAVQN
jgi:hypothetical protein